MPLVQINLDEDQDRILILYQSLKYLPNKSDAVRDLINTAGKQYVSTYLK